MIEEDIDYKVKYEELVIDHQQLRHELDQLKRLVFGSRSERFLPSVSKEQLALELNAQAAAITVSAEPVVQKIEYSRVQKQVQDLVRIIDDIIEPYVNNVNAIDKF